MRRVISDTIVTTMLSFFISGSIYNNDTITYAPSQFLLKCFIFDIPMRLFSYIFQKKTGPGKIIWVQQREEKSHEGIYHQKTCTETLTDAKDVNTPFFS